jgi:hypothetical protein
MKINQNTSLQQKIKRRDNKKSKILKYYQIKNL